MGEKPQSGTRHITLLTLLGVVVSVVVPVFVLTVQRSQEADWAKTETIGNAKILAQQLHRSLESVDLILQTITGHVERDFKGVRRSRSEVSKSLAAIKRFRPEFYRILITDKAGKVIHSDSSRSFKIDASKLRSYQAHVNRGRRGLFAGELVNSKKANLQFLALSRPYFSPNGEFAGVTIAILRRNYFVDLLKSFEEDKSFDATILSKNGRILAASNEQAGEKIYQQKVTSEAFEKWQLDNTAQAHEGFVRNSPDKQIIAFAHIKTYPYLIMASVPVDEVMRSWTFRAYAMGGLAVFALAIIFFVYTMAKREALRRMEIEERLIVEKDRAEQATKAKSEFLSKMSHELRTPLNAVLGFGQLLANNKREPLSPRQERSVNHILKGGNHLLQLIDEILNLSKIESGRLDISMGDVSLDAVFAECFELTKPSADERGITVVHSPNPELIVRADRIRLVQALLNFMSNAIKYNQSNGMVTIGYEETQPGRIKTFVKDTGKGIPHEIQSALFEPFNRLGAEQTDVEGTGIGLTITKQLIEAMGGEIGFTSKFGKGSTFWFELEAAEAAQVEAIQHMEDLSTLDLNNLALKGKVLYIEDNAENLHLMESIFEDQSDLKLISAASAELGLPKAMIELPDLILMDINLPGMDGFEALKILQNDRKTKNIPVIAVSAASMPHDIKKGEDAGFQAYLTKPLQIAETLRVLEKTLRS